MSIFLIMIQTSVMSIFMITLIDYDLGLILGLASPKAKKNVLSQKLSRVSKMDVECVCCCCFMFCCVFVFCFLFCFVFLLGLAEITVVPYNLFVYSKERSRTCGESEARLLYNRAVHNNLHFFSIFVKRLLIFENKVKK